MTLYCGRKPEYQNETHKVMHRTKPTEKAPYLRIKPRSSYCDTTVLTTKPPFKITTIQWTGL